MKNISAKCGKRFPAGSSTAQLLCAGGGDVDVAMALSGYSDARRWALPVGSSVTPLRVLSCRALLRIVVFHFFASVGAVIFSQAGFRRLIAPAVAIGLFFLAGQLFS